MQDNNPNWWRRDQADSKPNSAEVATGSVAGADSQPATQTNDEMPEPTPEVDQPAESVADNIDDSVISWEAADKLDFDRSKLWYGLFGAIMIALIAVGIFIMNSWTFVIAIVVMSATAVIYWRLPTSKIKYTLSASQGLYIGDKLFSYDNYKAFGFVRDTSENCIMLIPTKRFAPMTSFYFPEEKGEQIIDMLGAVLPMEQVRLDVLDRLTRKLRL